LFWTFTSSIVTLVPLIIDISCRGFGCIYTQNGGSSFYKTLLASLTHFVSTDELAYYQMPNAVETSNQGNIEKSVACWANVSA
jgi:hypothetical protein